MQSAPTVIDLINRVIDAINSIPSSQIVAYGKFIGGMLSVIFLVGIIVVSRKVEELTSGKKHEALGSMGAKETQAAIIAEAKHRAESQKAWNDVLAKIYSTNASDWLAAVIQADAIMDEILKHMGLPGDTMAERLQALDVSKLRSLQEVWDAHKVRNRVAHAPQTMLRHNELLEAVEKYKKALKELEYID